ncbi:hypothetical protein M413DRAFT_445201 [Hebeloma cylindrosporum]|uniref:Uncharacterized protein n=1 Tax=Hebeloma cylindrosporum TaxID=76867 RepID=A0A0C3CEF3_HEBCY|nr:hypothetical protein M413DRAFT_445201 [Hebeloma cylindrosporum h7]
MSLSTTSTSTSSSSLFSSISTTPQTMVAETTSTSASIPTGGGPPNNSPSGTLATSAALYLYTFLATLVLLLTVSAAIVIRSFVLRRRHRRMVEEAIRNGTWVPPSPPSRAAKVDLSKKPILWEAYIDNKGSISYSHGGGGSINPDWTAEQPKEWDMIRPISAAYLPSSTAMEPTDSTPTNPIPGPTPIDEPPSDPGASPTRISRPRAIFSRAMRMLNPTPVETSPLPVANLPDANTNAGVSGAGDAHISMTELDEKRQSPSLMRVAVLIAMPSPPSSSSSSSSSTSPSTAVPLPGSVSTEASSSSSPSPPPPPIISPSSSPAKPSITTTQSHPLQINPAFPLPLSPTQDEEPLLPHIEMGVADVLVVPPDSVTQEERIRERMKLRGSVLSRDSVATEVW